MENCPYCNAEIEINHDDGYGYNEDEINEQECGHCEKTFVFRTSVSYYYDIDECPCKNGDGHDLQQIHGAPMAYFVGKKRCTYCGEVFVNKVANDKAIEEYYKPNN